MIKYIYSQMFYLQECGDFTWREPDCEELVGVINRRGWLYLGYKSSASKERFSHLSDESTIETGGVSFQKVVRIMRINLRINCVQSRNTSIKD